MTDSYSLGWLDSMAGLAQSFDLPPELMPDPSEIRLASVLVPIFRHQGGWHLLFIRRVENERDRHSGQVAFPGGRRDEADTDSVATAMREAEEEIGLPVEQSRVLMVLDDYMTSSHYCVTPVVATIPWPYDYRPQPSEVGRIFSIPLSWLSDSSNVQLRQREIRRGDKLVESPVVYFDTFDGETLWGASARMTIAFLRALHQGKLVLPETRDD